MLRSSTVRNRIQHENLFDFPASELFRGRYADQRAPHHSRRLSDLCQSSRQPQISDDQLVDAMKQELLGWKSKASDLESRCTWLETEVNRLQDLLTAPRDTPAERSGMALSGRA